VGKADTLIEVSMDQGLEDVFLVCWMGPDPGLS
jgi:hypothetical protein